MDKECQEMEVKWIDPMDREALVVFNFTNKMVMALQSYHPLLYISNHRMV
jgi:hypothetical protein